MANKKKQSETTIQIRLVNRFKWMYPKLADLCFAIPNGGKRDAKTAMILKNMGVTGGVPDVFLAIPCHPFHGLFVELKTPDGSLSEDQHRVIAMLHNMMYDVVVFDDIDLAWSYIVEYVKSAENV